MKFNIRFLHNILEIEGEEITLEEYPDLKFVLHDSYYEDTTKKKGSISISEYTTGCRIVSGFISKELLIQVLRETLFTYSSLDKDIYKAIKDHPIINHVTQYVITGITKNGKRFKPIRTETPQHYNIWKGTIWVILSNGKRKKLQTINN